VRHESTRHTQGRRPYGSIERAIRGQVEHRDAFTPAGQSGGQSALRGWLQQRQSHRCDSYQPRRRTEHRLVVSRVGVDPAEAGDGALDIHGRPADGDESRRGTARQAGQPAQQLTQVRHQAGSRS
jgi:hypothetical protein